MKRQEETIAAIATAPGEGAIALLRLSGESALGVADLLFCGKVKPSQMQARHVYFGTIVHEGEILDEVLLTVFHAPKSYTGEDLVEVSCHGGSFIAARILQALLAQGARMARPGEFTRRAYLNGKMDLTQAEAVMDLISAQTVRAQRNATEQLAGSLGQKIRTLREELLMAAARVEAFIDFPEEDLDIEIGKDFYELIEKCRNQFVQLLATANEGRLLREGIRIALCGVPNAGKSSLLNRLLGIDRAIVSNIPGTTRDTLEEVATLGGFPFRLVDTAGLRPTDDLVEREGVRRARDLATTADICLHLVDGEKIQKATDTSFLEIKELIAQLPLEQKDSLISESIKDSKEQEVMPVLFGKELLVVNKIDLIKNEETYSLLKQLAPSALLISCVTGEGIDELINKIIEAASGNAATFTEASSQGAINARHAQALQKALQSLDTVLALLKEHQAPELFAIEVRNALEAVGSIVGETNTEEILGEIFENFCIGK